MEIKHTTTAAEHRRIRQQVRRAVATGVLVKPTACAWCGDESRPIHGHHPDYNRPLMVLWLCNRCHGRQTADDTNERRLFAPLAAEGANFLASSHVTKR